jgi:hypothetical protein
MEVTQSILSILHLIPQKNEYIMITRSSIGIFAQTVNSSSQTSQAMYNTDVFIVEIKLDSLYSEKRIRLNFGKGNKCFALHRVNINKVYYIADSSYLNREDLLGSKYVLVPCKIDVHGFSQFFASIYATTTSGVFMWSRLLSKKDIDFNKIWYSSVVRNVEISSRKLGKYLSNGKDNN